MDILYLVDRLENLIAGSRRMPLVNQIIVKESEILSIIEQMRTTIPDEVKQSRRVIQEKERILAQAQAEATALLARAREEGARAVNREGLLKVAEERSQQLLQKTEEQVHQMIRRAEEHSEHLKVDADAYVVETLRNLREHLTSVETDVSRTILSIERGLESLQEQPIEQGEDRQGMDEVNNMNDAEGSGQIVDGMEDPAPQAARSVPRRASLAADTMGGPNYQ